MMKRINQRQALIGANISITLLLIITLFFCINKWHSDWILIKKSSEPVALPALSQQNALIANLPALHVFGNPVENVSNVTVSSLELRITGIVTVTGVNNASSKAYISISNQPSKVFKIGDIISPGVKLYDVTDHAVVVENNGRLEKLPLIRQPLEFKPRTIKEGN